MVSSTQVGNAARRKQPDYEAEDTEGQDPGPLKGNVIHVLN